MFHKVNYNKNEEINGRDYSNSILLIIDYFIKIKYLYELSREKTSTKKLHIKKPPRGFFYNVSELHIKPLNAPQSALTLRSSGPGIVRTWANNTVVRTLFHHMRCPTRDTAHHEDWCE